jgi:hypothetical protein
MYWWRDKGDHFAVNELFEMLKNPYDEQPNSQIGFSN